MGTVFYKTVPLKTCNKSIWRWNFAQTFKGNQKTVSLFIGNTGNPLVDTGNIPSFYSEFLL